MAGYMGRRTGFNVKNNGTTILSNSYTYDNAGRLLSVTCDATHFVNCRGYIEIADCNFEYMMDDAEICIAAFGIAARVSKNAINEARKEGIKVGMIRPITLWPFPKDVFRRAADKVNSFISVELSMGQMIEDVRLATECKKPVTLCNRAGGMIPSPEQVLEAIQKAAKGGEN